jgi:hypothetical protein
MENIQEKFFSKNNISLLNNKLLGNLDVRNLNEKQRILIAQTIVNNMKNMWKTLDLTKIRPDNVQSVLVQFNTIVSKNSFEELNKLFTKAENNIDPASKKFERDFNSNPNKGVMLNERPKTIISKSDNSYNKSDNSWIGPNEQYVKRSQERQNLAGQPDKNLDSLFRPIVDEIPDEAKFNNYTVGRGGDSKEKLQDIQRMRDTEVPGQRKAYADVPDFLKPRETSVRSQDDFSEKKNINININTKTKTKTDNCENNLNFIDGTDDNENLYSLDNIDKPLIDEEDYEEDHSSFADRLSRLKNDRENIKVPKQGSVDFKSETFSDNFDEIQPTRIDKLKNKKSDDNNYKRQDDNYKRSDDNNYKRQDDNYKRSDDNNYKRQEIDNYKRQEMDNYKRSDDNNYKRQEMDNYKRSEMDNYKRSDDNNYKRQEIDNYKRQEIDNYKRQEIDNYKKQELDNYKKSSPNKLTTEQRELFDKMKDLNKNLLGQLKVCKEENSQLRTDNLELAEKLQEIIHKEKELDEKYGNIINTKNYQLEINPESSISNYRYNFNTPMNVSGIKLTNCSIPFKKFNIESDINNIFLYTMNNIEKKIILSPGYYTIDEIIVNLNLNQKDLLFELNSVSQKVQVVSESNFNIVPTTLSIINLGFKSNYNNNNTYFADTIYDLRINNKVYLYFKNISNEPISIIMPNTNIYDSEILFENPVKLNHLDIAFKDENENDYNFYNISHYIHLNLIIKE